MDKTGEFCYKAHIFVHVDINQTEDDFLSRNFFEILFEENVKQINISCFRFA